MTLLRADPTLRVLTVCNDEALRHSVEQCLRTAGSAAAGSTIEVFEETGHEPGPEGKASPDVIVVEVGGPSGLDLFRTVHDRFPGQAIVVYAASGDAELAEVATHHGADDMIFDDEMSPLVLHRVVRFANERNAMTRQLIAAREREAQLATHDSVTGVANRSLLFTCINQAVTFAQRQNSGLAVAAIDIRDLHGYNRRFGYRAGDRILSVVAERMLDSIRTSDMIGRLGGDDFVVLLRDIRSASGAASAVENILGEIMRPIYAAGHRLTIEAQAGISICPTEGEDADTLVTLAQDALLNAQRNGTRFEYAGNSALQSTG